MPSRPRRESLLTHRMPGASAAPQSGSAEVVLCEHAFLGHINLRGDPASAAFRHAAASTLGFPPPTQPNTFVDAEGTRACWLGPDEWLVICDGEKEQVLAEGLRSALDSQFAAVTIMSGGQTVVGLSGPRAIDLLATGCALDLHPRAFGPGRCAQTHIARAGALVIQTGASPCFELVVCRSYADYFWLWLTDAAEGYNCAVVQPLQWKAGLSEPVVKAASAA